MSELCYCLYSKADDQTMVLNLNVVESMVHGSYSNTAQKSEGVACMWQCCLRALGTGIDLLCFTSDVQLLFRYIEIYTTGLSCA